MLCMSLYYKTIFHIFQLLFFEGTHDFSISKMLSIAIDKNTTFV